MVATWNFYESGHGKSVPDGVGGSLKRTANHLVLQGNDIIDASSFVKLLTRQGSVVFIYQVSEADIAVVTQALEKQETKAYSRNIQTASNKNNEHVRDLV